MEINAQSKTGNRTADSLVVTVNHRRRLATSFRPVSQMPLTLFELTAEQSRGNHVVATLYKVIQKGRNLTREQLDLGNTDWKKFYLWNDSMRIREDGVLELEWLLEKTGWYGICTYAGPLWCGMHRPLVTAHLVLPRFGGRGMADG